MDISRVDHIVYAFKNLKKGIDHINALTGVSPSIGGRHLEHGTHNALLSLGPQCYLELIAPDPTNIYNGKRWMAVDDIIDPTITRWSINTPNITEDANKLSSISPQLGEVIKGERILKNGNLLKWEMTKPKVSGIIETIPFLLNWSQSEKHPCDNLEQKCEIVSIKLKTQNVNALELILEKSSQKIEIVKSQIEQISITLNTPRGIIII